MAGTGGVMNEIRNCTWKFAFQCPRRWEGLRETGDAKVRMCESCLKEVYLCADDEEVRARAGRGECVAVYSKINPGEMLLGELEVP